MVASLGLPDERAETLAQLMRLLGADRRFNAYRNLLPVFRQMLAIVDETELGLGFHERNQRAAITDLIESIPQLPPNRLPLRAPSMRRGNPLGDSFKEYPILAALLEHQTNPWATFAYAQTILTGLALSASAPGVFSRLPEFANALRLAADPQRQQSEWLARLYRAPERGLHAIRRFHAQAERLSRDRSSDPLRRFARTMQKFTSLYLEQWASLGLSHAQSTKTRFTTIEPIDVVGGEPLAVGFVAGGEQTSSGSGSDEPEPPRLVVSEPDSPNADGPLSTAGLAATARITATRFRFNSRSVPWSTGRLNPYELRCVVEQLHDSASIGGRDADPPATLIAALILATGADLEHCLDFRIGESGDLTRDGVYRRRVPSVHPSGDRQPDPDTLGDAPNVLRLQLPTVMIRLLGQLGPSMRDHEPLGTTLGGVGSADWARRISATFTPVVPGGKRQVTPVQLRETLRGELIRARPDPACLFALTARETDLPPTGALYTTIDAESLQRVHSAVMEQVFQSHAT